MNWWYLALEKMSPEVQKDTNLERVETEAVAVEHLPGESVARWKGGRVELEQLPGERKEQREEEEPVTGERRSS